MTYRLHGFAQSGNSYKAALYLACAGLDWTPVLIQYGAGETRDPAWREQVNEMGEAPVLEADGMRLSQSGAILTWLAEKTGRFGPRSEMERFEALRWILFDNHKFTSYLATYRYLKVFAPAPPDPAVEAFLRARVEASLAIAETHLKGRAYMLGGAPSIADFSMAGYVFFPSDELGFDLRESHPAIHAWTERMRALSGWRAPYDLLPPAEMPRRPAG